MEILKTFSLFVILIVLNVASSANLDHASFLPTTTTTGTTEKVEIIKLLKYEREHHEDGSYKFEYAGDDGSYRQEDSQVIEAGTEEEALAIKGSYRYIDANGEEIIIHYSADKNGFVPVGNNIPLEISEAAKEAANVALEHDKEMKHAKNM